MRPSRWLLIGLVGLAGCDEKPLDPVIQACAYIAGAEARVVQESVHLIAITPLVTKDQLVTFTLTFLVGLKEKAGAPRTLECSVARPDKVMAATLDGKELSSPEVQQFNHARAYGLPLTGHLIYELPGYKSE